MKEKNKEDKVIEMINPLVSIIIPAYNQGKYIHKALSSIFTDSYSPKEVIVVNDGSTDNTAEIVAAFPNIQYIYQKNQGVSVSRNTGINASKGAFIAFLDSDDIWIPGRLKYSIEYFLNHPDIEYVLGKQQMFLEKGCTKPQHIKPEWLERPQSASNPGVLMTKRVCFEKIGLFNPDYVSGEDTEWLLRANEANIKMARISLTVINRRIHNTNLSVNSVSNLKSTVFKMMRESIRRQKNKEI